MVKTVYKGDDLTSKVSFSSRASTSYLSNRQQTKINSINMKFFAAILLLAFVATAYSASLPAVEQSEIKPETEAEPVPSAAAPEQQRDKRGVLVGAYPAAYTYGAYPAYAASYSYPVAYSAPLTYPAYRSYYPSYYSSYVVG